VDLLFWVTLVIVADALIGNWLGIMGYIDGGWFWFGNQGLSYIQLGRSWQIGFFIGLVLWSLLVFRALWLTAAMLWQATRQFWTGRIRLERLIWAATINIAVRKVLHAHRFLALVGRASMGRAVVRILRCQLGLGLVYFCLRYAAAERAQFDERLGLWAFWLYNAGLVLWIALNFFPIGWPPLNAVFEHGLAYARSIRFYETTLVWQWLRLPGDVVFAVAALLMAWDFLLKLGPIYARFVEQIARRPIARMRPGQVNDYAARTSIARPPSPRAVSPSGPSAPPDRDCALQSAPPDSRDAPLRAIPQTPHQQYQRPDYP
jgi:hypothetical protein